MMQLGSNVTDYTIILELYNFTDNQHHLRAIGQKLQAMFSLSNSRFTGCHQKGDCTMLQNQHPIFDLPQTAKDLMDDVSMMAINRGVTEKGKKQYYTSSTLQAAKHTLAKTT